MVELKKQEHLDTIAMRKKSKTKYRYQGEKFNVKEIYSRNKKRRGRSRYLLSVLVEIEKDGESIPAKLVFVRNKSKRKDWLVLVSTDVSISEEEIILVKEYRGISYDAMGAHVAIVFARYMMLSVAQRENEDDKTICELGFCLLDEMEDITFSRSMCIIIDALMDTVMDIFISRKHMYRPDIKRKQSGTPVLSRKEIDIMGENLVGEFMPEALKTPQEIDIDLFVQDYLGMEQDFQYLSHCGLYLGMTVFNDTDRIPVYNPVETRYEKLFYIERGRYTEE